jgi:hypothetical protein
LIGATVNTFDTDRSQALVPLNLKDSAELQVQLKVCEEKARTKKVFEEKLLRHK